MGNTLTAPIPTATGKQRKPRKQTKTQNRMGWDNFRAPHPHKEKNWIFGLRLFFKKANW
jgi:hypothetical protein